MNQQTEDNPFFERAWHEHRELNRSIHELEQCFALAPLEATPQSCREAAAQLQRLRDHLAAHFAQEEEGGYLEEALSRVPRFGPQAAVLERQHAPLLARLDALVQRVCQTQQAIEGWPQLAADFRGFVQSLLEHEIAENRIVQAACNRDLDLDD